MRREAGCACETSLIEISSGVRGAEEMPRRISLSLKRDEALRATRVTIGRKKLVYLLIADKRLKYELDDSRIAYIGTTKKGVARIAQSVASKADEILSTTGVRTFHARVVTCNPRKNVKTWIKLERGLLLCFRERFGSIPKCNQHGKGIKETDEFRYFSRSAVENVIDELT
jgi:hypothetical protein